MIPGLKFWDMCAGEALIQSMMGVVCDANHKPLIYDHTLADYTIQQGIMVAKNKKAFDVANERLIQNTGRDMPHFHAMAQAEAAEYQRKKAARLAGNAQ